MNYNVLGTDLFLIQEEIISELVACSGHMDVFMDLQG